TIHLIGAVQNAVHLGLAGAAEHLFHIQGLFSASSYHLPLPHIPRVSSISTTSVSMPIMGPQSTTRALQMRWGLRQSWHLPSILQGVSLGKRWTFWVAAVFLAR